MTPDPTASPTDEPTADGPTDDGPTDDGPTDDGDGGTTGTASEPAPVAASPTPEGPQRRRLRRTWPQRLLMAVGATASLCSFISAGVVHTVADKASNVQRIAIGAALADPPTNPTIVPSAGVPQATRPADATTPTGGSDAASADAVTILVVGVDNADGLAADDRRRIDRDDGLRSDTIMLVRLDPATGLAALLSFPRDLWLPLGGDGFNDRINAALPLGGPELLIRTISENFGVPINHFVQVDFAQFAALVDAVGGVPFPFAYPVRDDNSGLYVGEAGCVVLDGSAALDYVRSRYLQRLVEGEWEADPAADLSRIRRQQDFLRRAFARAKDKGLSNPVTANRLINAGIGAITVDETFGADKMLRLALRFRSLDPASLPTFALPTRADTTSGGAQILRVLPVDAEPVLDLFRGRNPFAPSAVRVGLSPDADPTIAAELTARGFGAATPEETFETPLGSQRGAASEIHFGRFDRYRAELLAGWLDGPVQLVEEDAEQASGAVTLVVGDGLQVRDEASDTRPAWAEAATADDGFLPAGEDTSC